MVYLKPMRNEPAGWLGDVWDWLRTNVVVITTVLVGWSVLDKKIRKVSKSQIMSNNPIEELDDEVKLPKWLLLAQLISQRVVYGFIGAILFLNFMPGVKTTLSIKIAMGDGFVTLFDILIILLVVLALPFIILAGQKVDVSQYIKKS